MDIINEPKKTPLHDIHIKLGAKMVHFAGFKMPVQYTGIIKEHEAVRTTAGVFDISHMGELLLEGNDVISFLQYMMINDLNLLEPFKGQYSCMCYENGTVIDDMVYYEEDKTQFRMIVNAGNIEKDIKWLNEHIGERDVKIANLSSARARVAFQGPKSEEYLQPLMDVDLAQINRFYFRKCSLDGNPVFIARTGYTGERGFELSFDVEYATRIWNKFIEIGATPAGLGARDSLRLEACYSLYGHEINDSITPVEAGLSWLVKPKEGIDYFGKEVLIHQKTKGTERVLVGLNLLDKGIIRDDNKIFKDDTEIGYITSGGYSPTLKKTIGLGLVTKQYSEIGQELFIEIRNKRLKGIITSTPFYRNI